jgi:hypothetical protein
VGLNSVVIARLPQNCTCLAAERTWSDSIAAVTQWGCWVAHARTHARTCTHNMGGLNPKHGKQNFESHQSRGVVRRREKLATEQEAAIVPGRSQRRGRIPQVHGRSIGWVEPYCVSRVHRDVSVRCQRWAPVPNLHRRTQLAHTTQPHTLRTHVGARPITRTHAVVYACDSARTDDRARASRANQKYDASNCNGNSIVVIMLGGFCPGKLSFLRNW